MEAEERTRLSPLAAFSDSTRGRERAIAPDRLRTEYQRDRDRIIHCKSFRRLSHKTQVFIAPEGDHYRTRLTHTLEVAQIARSVARALRLNEDLTEAIALAHDLGHTPFGHTGEDAVTECLVRVRAEQGDRFPDVSVPFRHGQQSLRVVEVLEYEGKGLNLTWEVRDGIRFHSGTTERASTLEGRIVATADRIAYVNHDIDDALRGGIISEADLPRECTDVLGTSHGARIATMIRSMVECSAAEGDIRMAPEAWQAMMALRAFLFEHVYMGGEAKAEEPKAHDLVVKLFDYFLSNPDELPDDYRPATDAELPTAVTDYIAGMTDRYAIRIFERLFVPRIWRQV
ncbi:MAG: deoxyguanosinetriphosphate triphosphohydrolase [Coriobacteriia bacterium]|nr:deoxyguanosinetriphosphate triphosphohydrolase [Coriobacteriia bacterium]